ncbi:MAG TPA: pyruvate dehydrogenase complex E1 component subunit beta [Rhizomicrobium sp.]|nr:pyruvate dehydrogenase complex E1 component subunit beta [Rhizomicrobium sp.]
MSTQILMPALSPTMEEGKLAKWLVKEGDEVKSGDILAEIETDKATMEFEAVDEGRIGKILVPEGTEGVKVNQPIAELVGESEKARPAAAKEKASSFETRPAAAPQDDAELKSTSRPEERPAAASQDVAKSKPSRHPEERGPERQRTDASVSKGDGAAPEIPVGAEMVTQTVREALRDAMAEEMRRDESVFLIGEEVAQYQGAYKVSQGLLEEFGPRRVIDTPITEQGFAGLGVGAAFAGLKPIVEFMTWNFAMQAIDQIVNSAAKTRYMSGGQMHSPMVFRGPNGPASRVGAQHSQDYSSWYAHVPGLKVIAPYFASDAKGLLKAAIRDPNPVIFLENEIVYGRSFPVPKLDDFVLPIGKARVVRPGKDVTLVSYSICVGQSLEAAEKLAAEGIDAELIDLRTLRPLDTQTVIESVKKTNRIVTIEQGWPVCSIGSEICAVAANEAFDWLDAPPTKVAGKDVPMPYAANLEKLALPTVDEIVAAAKAVCYRS